MRTLGLPVQISLRVQHLKAVTNSPFALVARKDYGGASTSPVTSRPRPRMRDLRTPASLHSRGAYSVVARGVRGAVRPPCQTRKGVLLRRTNRQLRATASRKGGRECGPESSAMIKRAEWPVTFTKRDVPGRQTEPIYLCDGQFACSPTWATEVHTTRRSRVDTHLRYEVEHTCAP